MLVPKFGKMLDERRSASLQLLLQEVALVEEDDKLDPSQEFALTYPFPQHDAVVDTVHVGLFGESLIVARYRCQEDDSIDIVEIWKPGRSLKELQVRCQS